MARRSLVERRFAAFLREPVSVRKAMGVIVTATIMSVVLGGVLIRIVDEKDFPNVGIGMWWSLQTVTTVGYGDVVPTDFVGRLVGAVFMLEAIAFVAIVTAAITSTFVERARQERAASLGGRATIEGERLSAQLSAIQERLERIEQALHAGAPASDESGRPHGGTVAH